MWLFVKLIGLASGKYLHLSAQFSRNDEFSVCLYCERVSGYTVERLAALDKASRHSSSPLGINIQQSIDNISLVQSEADQLDYTLNLRSDGIRWQWWFYPTDRDRILCGSAARQKRIYRQC
jgi:hypothetical protein